MQLSSLIYLDASLRSAAQKMADQLSLRCIDGSSVSADSKALQKWILEQCADETGVSVFILSTNGLELYLADLKSGSIRIRSDFHGSTATYRRKHGGGKNQMIAKAIGIRKGLHPYVLDTTAGLGRDAFVLAGLGCRVTLIERVPAICALLEDGMKQARNHGVIKDSALLEIVDRMEVVQANAADYMNNLSTADRPDVIYLDPMFPPRTKSAQIKKGMQALHKLVGADSDADTLLAAALKCANYRVVVKRPRIAKALSGTAPSYALSGKRNRYDIYALQKLPDGLNIPPQSGGILGVSS